MGTKLSRFVFQPPRSSYSSHPSLAWLQTKRGEVVPAFHVAREGATMTVLFSHGNAEDLGLIVAFMREVSDALAVNVLAYEYTGYGLSTGTAGMPELHADIEAAFRYARDVLRVPWERLVLWGRSIGSGPTCHLASKQAVRGVILQAPPQSIYRVPFQLRYTLPGDLFPSIDRIGECECPVFVMHGTKDEIVPVWHGHGIYERCVKKGIDYEPMWVEGGDHNSLAEHVGTALFFQKLSKFLQYLEETPVSAGLQRQADASAL